MENNPKKSLKDLSNQMHGSAVNEVTSFVNEMHEIFVAEKPTASLPEHIFIDYFLDFFKSGAQLNTTSPLAIKWLELAGGPYNEVNILDRDGKIIYVTPGMYCRPNVDTDRLKHVDMHNIASKFNQKANMLYNSGTKYLDGQINNMDTVIKTDASEYTLRWQAIFKMYTSDGITQVRADTKEVTVEKPKAAKKLNAGTTAFLDYD